MFPWILLLIQLLGIAGAIQAVMQARTPQGAVAWAVALISFPYVALPLFLIFGRSKFEGYVIRRRLDMCEASPIAQGAHRALIQRGLHVETDHARELPFERLRNFRSRRATTRSCSSTARQRSRRSWPASRRRRTTCSCSTTSCATTRSAALSRSG